MISVARNGDKEEPVLFVSGHRTTRAATVSGHQNSQDTTENIPPAAPIARSRLVQPNRMSSSNIPQMHSQQTSQPPPSQQTNQPRRSYAVKEVEKLKENREKRRARQAEMKEEKNALMNLDPGNPNWELAKMIRFVCFLWLGWCVNVLNRVSSAEITLAKLISGRWLMANRLTIIKLQFACANDRSVGKS